MTRRSIPQIIFVASVALAATAVPHAIFAATNLNFTGKYVHRTGKGGSDVDPEITLDVVQNDQTVEVTREASVGKTSNQYSLNGSEQDCVSSTGVSAKCKAQLKGKAPSSWKASQKARIPHPALSSICVRWNNGSCRVTQRSSSSRCASTFRAVTPVSLPRVASPLRRINTRASQASKNFLNGLEY